MVTHSLRQLKGTFRPLRTRITSADMGGTRLVLGVAFLAISMFAALWNGTDVSAATITPAGTNYYEHQRITTFYRLEEPPIFLVTSTVTANHRVTTSKAYYDPGPPFVASPMLAVVVYNNREILNTGGVSWGTGIDLQVPGVGYLNGYLVFFQSGGSPVPPNPYSVGCNIIPTPTYCWRGVPDWLISTSLDIRADYSLSSGLPWQRFSNWSGTLQGPWW